MRYVQLVFIVYMILVTLLLVNMLIAMMGHTYETVNESQKEWYRQVRHRAASSATVSVHAVASLRSHCPQITRK